MNEERKIILKGEKVYPGRVEGQALVSKMPLMGWLNVDAEKGVITERNHPLKGISFKGKILVFPGPRGSGGFVSFGRSKFYGQNPAAFVYTKGNNLTIFAAMEAKVPAITNLDQDPTEVIETGDWVVVDADLGIVEITKK
ncbi:DUF126 domain-containing protein [Alkalibacter rhizosphaerae]|uniref:DUF126 domain-containing protein n=1 Tax=Alkalibacter rhizosphaerae TaxID=2815577 RepID=A0A974XGB1_9FIRM|nr:DUF126 domain-containing protein [Alkalibacter rhizosphaerae]QSX09236.1 DUF126 domain-containing protein [Alkalibacter rhizosphaerae]